MYICILGYFISLSVVKEERRDMDTNEDRFVLHKQQRHSFSHLLSHFNVKCGAGLGRLVCMYVCVSACLYNAELISLKGFGPSPSRNFGLVPVLHRHGSYEYIDRIRVIRTGNKADHNQDNRHHEHSVPKKTLISIPRECLTRALHRTRASGSGYHSIVVTTTREGGGGNI